MSTILVVNSSARNNSNSRVLTEKVVEKAFENGHTIQTLDVGKETIHHCIGCDVCRKNNDENCIFNDAMTKYRPLVKEAGIIIFASPIYYFSVSAQLKLFIDRCYALGSSAFRGKKVGAVFTYGDSDEVSSGCVNAINMMKDICNFASASWLGAVHGTAWGEGTAVQNAKLMQMAEKFGAALK